MSPNIQFFKYTLSSNQQHFPMLCVSHLVVSNPLQPHGLSMEFSRQECWSGLPFPSPGDPPDPGIKLGSSVLQTDFTFLGSKITADGDCRTDPWKHPQAKTEKFNGLHIFQTIQN